MHTPNSTLGSSNPAPTTLPSASFDRLIKKLRKRTSERYQARAASKPSSKTLTVPPSLGGCIPHPKYGHAPVYDTAAKFKELTERIMTIAAGMHGAVRESALLLETSKNRPLSLREYKRYVLLKDILITYEDSFGDAVNEP
jgi:hypothetical protein